MCWEMDYEHFVELKKAQETKIKEEQRTGVIEKLLINANKQAENTDDQGAPLQEVMPAK